MDKEYWTVVCMKLVETFISIKVWIIFAVLYLSTYLLLYKYISDTNWVIINTGVISTVVVVREGFKISRIKKDNELVFEDDEECEYNSYGNHFQNNHNFNNNKHDNNTDEYNINERSRTQEYEGDENSLKNINLLQSVKKNTKDINIKKIKSTTKKILNKGRFI